MPRSTLCLIPWRLKLGQVTLLSGEQGIVGTAEPYRRRGLIRTQFAYFQQRLHAHGCLLSHIQGIAYYYRQFGYQYTLPLEGGLRIELQQAPAPLGREHHVRLATAADIPSWHGCTMPRRPSSPSA